MYRRRGSYSIDRILSWSFKGEHGVLECHMTSRDGEVGVFKMKKSVVPARDLEICKEMQVDMKYGLPPFCRPSFWTHFAGTETMCICH